MAPDAAQMGCAVGVGSGRLKVAEAQVRDLRTRLEEVEEEREALRQTLEETVKASTSAASSAKVPDAVKAEEVPEDASTPATAASLARPTLNTPDGSPSARDTTLLRSADEGRQLEEKKPLLDGVLSTETTAASEDDEPCEQSVAQILGDLPGVVTLDQVEAQHAVEADPSELQDEGETTKLVDESSYSGKSYTDIEQEAKAAGLYAEETQRELIVAVGDEVDEEAAAEEVAAALASLEQNGYDVTGIATDAATPRDRSAADASPRPDSGQSEVLLEKTEKCKLSNSLDSDASTCTPAAVGLMTLQLCTSCQMEVKELHLDPSDMQRYCVRCWTDYYGNPPSRTETLPLVSVEVAEYWSEARLAHTWSEMTLPGWPPSSQVRANGMMADPSAGEVWSSVTVRVRRDIVGPHAREQCQGSGPVLGEMLRGRYCIVNLCGEGHFTKAYLAEDLDTDTQVCLKRHRNLSVEMLGDLMVLGRRMQEVDPGSVWFPRLLDSFYDFVGYTVESFIEGRNCHTVAQTDTSFFLDMRNLSIVARGCLLGLKLLHQAGILHCDIKPDNVLWVEAPTPLDAANHTSTGPSVRLVDFGCARLDSKEEGGRNWSLAEGGAGHLGKWSPEMALRLPITHQTDVWGVAVSLCELHCLRSVWRNESDTAEVVLAQALGLCGLESGLPSSLLRRSPLDVRQLYTPATSTVRGHLPLRRNALGQLEALRPSTFGLDHVLGEDWSEAGKADLGDFLQAAFKIDPAKRPSADELLERCRFVHAPLSAAEAVASET